MTKIKDLSRTELLNFLYNYYNTDLSMEVQCALCGDSPDNVCYVCDRCEEELVDE